MKDIRIKSMKKQKSLYATIDLQQQRGNSALGVGGTIESGDSLINLKVGFKKEMESMKYATIPNSPQSVKRYT